MDSETVKSISYYVAFAVPITVAITNIAKIILKSLNQSHQIKSSQNEQKQRIITHYLEKALNPEVPLAIRHQLLRFLATPDTKGERLSIWAKSELNRVGEIIEETNRTVEIAEKKIHLAKTPMEIQVAEEELTQAIRQQKSLLKPPMKPPVTAASLRAGLIDDKEMLSLEMVNADLSRMILEYRNLRGANFSGSNLERASLQGCDLRAVSFKGSNLTDTVFFAADLRGANFQDATIKNTNFQQARLENADLSGAKIEDIQRMGATYNKTTKWPEAFDPKSFGAVLIEEDGSIDESFSSKEGKK